MLVTVIVVCLFPPGLWQQALQLWLELLLHGFITDRKGPGAFCFWLLAFGFFSVTPVHRFICSYIVLPAGNCLLVAPSFSSEIWFDSKRRCIPSQSVVRTQACGPPAWRLLIWASEENWSLHGLCWGRWLQESGSSRLCCKHLWHLCTRAEHTEICLKSPEACVSG